MARTLDMGIRLRFMALARQYNLAAQVDRKTLVGFCDTHKLQYPQWLTMDKTLTVSRGIYRIPYDRFPDTETPTEEVPSTTSCFLTSPPMRPRTTTSKQTGSFNDRFERALKAAAGEPRAETIPVED